MAIIFDEADKRHEVDQQELDYRRAALGCGNIVERIINRLFYEAKGLTVGHSAVEADGVVVELPTPRELGPGE